MVRQTPARSKKLRNPHSSSASSHIDTLRTNPSPTPISSQSVWVICEFEPRLLPVPLKPTSKFRVAGSDTSSTTITYILWELSKRPAVVRKLQAELDEAMPDSQAIPDISILQELPYLSGVVKEGATI